MTGGNTRLVTVMSGIFVASGAGLSLVAARHFIRQLAFIRHSAVTDGVVVALREERDGMDTQRVRFPRVRFRTASGRDVTFEAGMARGGAAWHIGEVVSVRYLMDHPERAEFDSVAALWGPTMMFALLAIVFVSVGVGLWFGFIPGKA
jgi:Protein of unknown function (DUF3592)